MYVVKGWGVWYGFCWGLCRLVLSGGGFVLGGGGRWSWIGILEVLRVK